MVHGAIVEREMEKRRHISTKLSMAALMMGISLLSTVGALAETTALPCRDGISEKGQCDLFTGKWVHNPLGPPYPSTGCKYIDSQQDCLMNGRPNTEYLYWRWKPYDCELPRFDPEKFLNSMQDKSWAFIGDSIFRNHMESLLCSLSKVEEPIQVCCDWSYKYRTWYFPSHNMTLTEIWSPFLLKADIFEDEEEKAKYDNQLYLDTLESYWTSQYHNYDYIVISGGQWFTTTVIIWDNNTVVGCHNCPGKGLRQLDTDYSYHRALQLVFKFITTSNHKPLVFFRTWSPNHIEHEEWNTGGICNRTFPYREGEYTGLPVDHLMQAVEIDEFQKAEAIGLKNGTHLKLLDISHLSLLRPDGHPGPYGKFHPFDKDKNAKPQNDCLHWCLPGPIDSWNDLIMKMLLEEGDLRCASSKV